MLKTPRRYWKSWKFIVCANDVDVIEPVSFSLTRKTKETKEPFSFSLTKKTKATVLSLQKECLQLLNVAHDLGVFSRAPAQISVVFNIYSRGNHFGRTVCRLLSFRYFRNTSNSSVADLAEQGFYCRESGIIVCYQCGIQIDVRTETNIRELHKKISPTCIYVISFVKETDDSLLTIFSSLPRVNVPSPHELQRVPTANWEEQQLLHQQIVCGYMHGYFVDLFAATLNEHSKEMLLHHEIYRMKTFDAGWPGDSLVPAPDLAKSGFFYTGTSDRVQCVFCKGVLRNWDQDDKPMEEHAKHFTYCRFVQGHSVGNYPYMPWAKKQSNAENFDNIQLLGGGWSGHQTLGIVTAKPKKPGFSIESKRKDSFINWPVRRIRVDSLVAAGFFWQGSGDATMCFFCGGVVRDWQPNDDPWVRHAERLHGCPFLKQVKGQEFIDEHRNTAEDSEENLCNIGFDDDAEFAAFFPQNASKITVENRTVVAFMDTEIVRTVLRLGCDTVTKAAVREAVLLRLELTGKTYRSANDLYTATCMLMDRKKALEDQKREEPAAPLTYEVIAGGAAAAAASLNSTPSTLSGHRDSTQRNMPSRSDRQEKHGEHESMSNGEPSVRQESHQASSLPHNVTNTNNRSSQTHDEQSPQTQKLSTNDQTQSMNGQTQSMAGHTQMMHDQSQSTNGQSQSMNGQTQINGQLQSLTGQNHRDGRLRPNRSNVPVSTDNKHNAVDNETPEQDAFLMTCKVCLNAPVSIVFLPCGHLVCCVQCSVALNNCPICRKHIKGTVRTFMS